MEIALVAHVKRDAANRTVRFLHKFDEHYDNYFTDNFLEITRKNGWTDTTITIPLKTGLADGNMDIKFKTEDRSAKRKREEEEAAKQASKPVALDPETSPSDAKRAKRIESAVVEDSFPKPADGAHTMCELRAERRAENKPTKDAESLEISRLNETPEGRLELLEKYWRPVISDFNRMRLMDVMLKASTVFDGPRCYTPRDKREGDEVVTPHMEEKGYVVDDKPYKIHLDYDSLVWDWKRASVPLPTKDELHDLLIVGHPSYDIYCKPGLPDKSKYDTWAWAFVKHQMIRYCEAYRSGHWNGSLTEFITDHMQYAVLKSWDAVIELNAKAAGGIENTRFVFCRQARRS